MGAVLPVSVEVNSVEDVVNLREPLGAVISNATANAQNVFAQWAEALKNGETEKAIELNKIANEHVEMLIAAGQGLKKVLTFVEKLPEN